MTFDPDDDGVLHVTHKGKSMSFEMDKVFIPSATQEEVRAEHPGDPTEVIVKGSHCAEMNAG